MNVQVYGCNHVAIEVGDIKDAVAFYQDLFALEKLDEGEGDAFFKLGEHQFLAMFEHKNMSAEASDRHFGIMVRDANQVAEVRNKLTKKYNIELIPPSDATSEIHGATEFRWLIYTTSLWFGCCRIEKSRKLECHLLREERSKARRSLRNAVPSNGVRTPGRKSTLRWC
jgi:Glyoxalase/Bleomycin resistance protein/Dioxygenase superfamily